MTEINTVLVAWMTIFALTIFIVSLTAYMRVKSKRILIVSIAFALFFVKGILQSIALFNNADFSAINILFDTAIILLLAFAILKK